MRSLILLTLLQWSRSPGRMALAMYPMFALVGMSIVSMLREEGISVYVGADWLAAAPGFSIFYTVLFGAGIISREREDGVLASVLARPLYRSTYVFSKWLALALAAFLGTCVMLSLQVALILGIQHTVDAAQVLIVVLQSLLTCLGLSATLVAFSTIAPTYGDLFLYGFAWLTLSMYTIIVEVVTGSAADSFFPLKPQDIDALLTFQHMIFSFLFPQFDLLTPVHEWPSMVLTYMSNLLSALLMSIFFLNRKEISYGG